MKKLVVGLCMGALLVSNAFTQENTIIDGKDFGPLAQLVGTWKTVNTGGIDIAPDQVKRGENTATPFFEVITFEVAADATNAARQNLNALYYKQEVFRKSDGSKFHDERGYFIYDKENNKVYNSFCVPRATCISAEGKAGNKMVFEAEDEGIAQSKFMSRHAQTNGFVRIIEVKNNILEYSQTISLDIYDSDMTHTDSSRLKKVVN